ncbi:hypothetical protein Afil01_37180 [Actinorhabdospora filicis]|uniref:TIGR02680 family protein n=1 Tax=Actinorhabdospora filicis TaxID=1785913 RepID=A0A9W6SQJ0_9ACTN|nr:hypothetical protein [Actinorhabdospora filicis]GLZ78911.1 hypothetical protein Afil01_37180 [Actinorhabdospora filicis]
MSVGELARPGVRAARPVTRWRLSRAGVHGVGGLDEVFACESGRLILRSADPTLPARVLRLICLPLDADVRAAGRHAAATVEGTGLVWLEFARDGETRVIGAALSALPDGRLGARFFSTPVPVGASLPLDDPARRPGLRDLPGLVGAGAVHADPAAYRSRVAELFGFDPSRPADVAHALRAARLSGPVLPGVLPAPDPALLAEATTEFADLAAAHRALAELERRRESALELRRAHAAYLGAVAASREARLREARAAVQDATRARDAARAEAARAAATAREADARLRAAPIGDGDLRARWRDLGHLHDLEHRLAGWDRAAASLALGELAGLRDEWSRTVRLAGASAVPLPGSPPQPTGRDVSGLGAALASWRGELRDARASLDTRVARARATADAHAAWSAARREAHEAGRRADAAETRLAAARHRAERQTVRRAEAERAHEADLTAWHDEAVAAGLPGIAGARPESVRDLAAPMVAHAAVERDATRSRVDALTAALAEATAERAALGGERRDGGWWTRVEFASGVSAAGQAGLEAALEGSGLLAARLGGHASGPYEKGVTVRVTGPVVGASLADVLISADPEVAATLRGIGLGESASAHWLGLDGRWRLGPVRGAHAKPRAELIGAANRAAARERDLNRADRRIAALAIDLAAATADCDAATGRCAALDGLLARMPSPAALRDAGAAQAQAELTVGVVAAELDSLRAAAAAAREHAAALRPAERGDAPEALARLADRVAAAAEYAGRLIDRLDVQARLSAAWEGMREQYAAASARYATGRNRTGAAPGVPSPGALLDAASARREALARARGRLDWAETALMDREREAAEAERAFAGVPAAPRDGDPGELESALRELAARHGGRLGRENGLVTLDADDLSARVERERAHLAERTRAASGWWGVLAAELSDRVQAADAILDRFSRLADRHGVPAVTWMVPDARERTVLSLLRARRGPAQEEQLCGLLAAMAADGVLARRLDPRTWGEWDAPSGPAAALLALAALYPEGTARPAVLDGAFDGLGEDAAAELVALATALDLDLIATSSGHWGHHGLVRELDAYELLGDPSGPAVAAVRVHWNGTRTATPS